MPEDITPAKSPKPIHDVAPPGTSLPSKNSRSVIISDRPLVRDPMMVESEQTLAAEQAASSSSEASQTPEEAKTQEPAAQVQPKMVIKPIHEDIVPDQTPNKARPPAASAEQTTAATPAAPDTPAEEQIKPADPDPDSASTDGVKLLDAQQASSDPTSDEDQDHFDALIASKKFFLPIKTTDKRKTTRFIVFGIIVALLLGASWLNIALDAGIVHVGTLKPLTHFFAQPTATDAAAQPAAATDCGKVTYSGLYPQSANSCFTTKFNSCSPAIVALSHIGTNKALLATLDQRIVGPLAGNCQVTTTFLGDSVNPAFNGTKKTCGYSYAGNPLSTGLDLSQVDDYLAQPSVLKTQCSGSALVPMEANNAASSVQLLLDGYQVRYHSYPATLTDQTFTTFYHSQLGTNASLGAATDLPTTYSFIYHASPIGCSEATTACLHFTLSAARSNGTVSAVTLTDLNGSISF